MKAGQTLNIPADGRESGAYVVRGEIKVGNKNAQQIVPAGSMVVANDDEGLFIEATQDSKLMLLGGQPVGPRFIFWNFVSSTKEKMEEAKKAWQLGPRPGARFQPIPGDDKEFIPLPNS